MSKVLAKHPCLGLSSLTCLRWCVETLPWIILVFLFCLKFSWADHLEPESLDPSKSLHFVKMQAATEFMKQQKWEEASSAYRAVLTVDPKSFQGVIGLALSLTYLEKREEALSILIQATSWTSSKQTEVLKQKIGVISRLFISNKVLQTYQDGMNFLLAKKYGNAREQFEKTIQSEPGNAEVLLRFGQSLVLENEPKLAAQKLEQAKKLNPFESCITLWLGRAYLQSGAVSQAVSELKKIQEGLNGSELAPVWYAEALASSNQLQQAIKVLDKDSKLWPFHLPSMILAARYRLQMNHMESQILWSARKDLQLALSRLDQYDTNAGSQNELELSINLRKSASDLKGEIQKLFQQVQALLDKEPKPKS